MQSVWHHLKSVMEEIVGEMYYFLKKFRKVKNLTQVKGHLICLPGDCYRYVAQLK